MPIKHDTTTHNGVNGTDLPPQKKKKLILNAFVEMCSGHQSPGLWRHPSDRSADFNDLAHWTSLAQTLEAGKFHGIFIADVLGGYDVYRGPQNLSPAIASGAQWPVNEPLSVVPAMAAVTYSLGFGVTVSTSYEQPYHLARRLSTVDHLTKGRLAWNVVTGYLDSAARNLSPSSTTTSSTSSTNGKPPSSSQSQLSHDSRYSLAEEYITVVYKLMNSSWRTDAVQLDPQTRTFTSPSLVRPINHSGPFFTVPGPHLCSPSPQRTPVIMQAGTSSSGKLFAAQHAEAVFVSAHAPRVVAPNVLEIRRLATQKFGRDGENGIKFLAKICPVLGRTREEAEGKLREYEGYGDREGALALFGGWTGVDLSGYGEDEELRYVESNAIRSYIEGLVKHAPDINGGKWTKRTLARHICVGGLGPTVVGTAGEVADEMERWVREGGVDGFNITYAIMPQTFTDVVELLIPELQRRGIFWTDYEVPGGTYRENLFGAPGQHEPFPDHPAAKLIWKPDIPATTKQKKSVGFSIIEGETTNGGQTTDGHEEEPLDDACRIDPTAMQLC